MAYPYGPAYRAEGSVPIDRHRRLPMRSRLAVCLAASLLTLSAVAICAPDPVTENAQHGGMHVVMPMLGV